MKKILLLIIVLVSINVVCYSYQNRSIKYPQLAYWKFAMSEVNDSSLIEKTEAFFKRSCLNLMILEPVEFKHQNVYDLQLQKRIKEMIEVAHKNGGRIALELTRNMMFELGLKYPQDQDMAVDVIEADLSDKSDYTCEYIPQSRTKDAWLGEPGIYKAYALKLTRPGYFDSTSVVDITEMCSMRKHASDSSKRIITVATNNLANYHVIIFPYMRFVRLDVFSEHVFTEYENVLKTYAPYKPDGFVMDEYGYDMPVDKDRTIRKIHCGPQMQIAYQKTYGIPFEKELIYFRLTPEGDEGRRLATINRFMDLIRNRIVETEEFFYDVTKKYLGKDAFSGTHPTRWNQKYSEAFHNGFNWWNVKRDYAQLDEKIVDPIKLALTRKRGPVWYNMWYTQSKCTMESYFEETWRNALTGGRTHYHSYYTAIEKGIVHEMYRKGDLERVSELEELIAKLNEFQNSRPDSKVAFIVGTQAICNFAIDSPSIKEFDGPGKSTQNSLIGRVANYSQDILESGYLCDFILDYEIEDGDVKLLKNGKIRYGTQIYDAVIYLYPECIKKNVLEFLNAYAKKNPKIILIGNANYYFDGSSAQNQFNKLAKIVKNKFAEMPNLEEITSIFNKWKIQKTFFGNGCKYQDGSVIFVAQGDKHLGNKLIVDAVVDGNIIKAEGEDLLALKLDKKGKIEKYLTSKLKSLTINGKDCLKEIK